MLMSEFHELASTLRQYLNFKGFAVGIKLLKEEDLKALEGRSHRFRPGLLMCQLFNAARLYGWTFIVKAEEAECILGAVSLGLREPTEDMESGELFVKLGYAPNKELGRKFYEGIPKLPPEYRGVLVAPLERSPLKPDLVFIYCNAAQLIRLIQAYNRRRCERLTFSSIGDVGTCGDGVAYTMLTRRPQVVLPCYGDRRFGHIEDDLMVFATPIEYLQEIAEGLAETHKLGVRYPVPIAGITSPLIIPDIILAKVRET